jgi:hypothetical protein
MVSPSTTVASRHNFSFNISGNQLIYIVFFDHCGWCESQKKYKIKVIHGACAGFSLKWLNPSTTVASRHNFSFIKGL